MIEIGAELQKARQKLLDLTMRNRLLNYRPSAMRSIRVTDEVPAEMYEALVLKEKALEFRGAGPPRRVSDREPAPQDRGEEWRPRSGTDLDARHTDRYLQTPYDNETLARKLFRVYHEGHSAVEEQGYTVIHLAIAFLEWYESADTREPRRAPLILVPVELERVRAGDFSKVKWTGEDVFANISLAAKLVDYGVVLPPFEPPEEKSGIDAWLQQVATAIARKPAWRVVSDMALDFFSFTKFVMFKDLDPASWPAEQKVDDHPLLRSLFHPSQQGDDGFDERDVDRKLNARDLWHVLDADPSQIAVVEDVKSGRNLVVQGPPGTGKSQTIANLIADTLAHGKTVLFVSEKMAALDVVKARLDEAGLGPFCLELHSRKANKKNVLLDLQRALKSQPLSEPADVLFDEHDLLKRDLNDYARQLGEPIGASAFTPYALFGMRQEAMSYFQQAERGTPPLPRIPNAEQVTTGDVVSAEKALRELTDAIPLVRPAAAHPWRHSALDAMLPHDDEEIRAAISSAQSALEAVVAAANDVAAASGARSPAGLGEVDRCVRAARVLSRAGAATESFLLLNAEWNAPNEQAMSLIERAEACQKERAAMLRTFTAVAVDGDLSLEFQEFWPLAGKLFRIFNARYRALRKQLAGAYQGGVRKTDQIVRDIASLVEHQRKRDAVRAERSAAGLFGARWRADRSDCSALREFADWIIAFRQEILSKALTEKAVGIAASRIDSTAVTAAIERLEKSATSLRERVSAFTDRVRLDDQAAFGGRLSEQPFEHVAAAFRVFDLKVPELFRWAQFNGARRAVRATPAAPIEALVIDDQLDEGAVLPAFHLALAESLLRVAFGERSALGTFVGDLHERKIARFRGIDRNLVALNRARLSRRLHDRRPLLSGGASRNSEAGILLGEFNRRRGHMAIRKLLMHAGRLVQRIKPCFLMSPLSIAQFLDPRGARFDLIVFDEASQVRPEDALGALLRGSQLVVMGDTQQLPPTSFFDILGSDVDAAGDDEDEELPQSASVTDVESILHQCDRSYPKKMLTWHYRSRHDSLIAISNQRFYENALRIFPSAIDWSDDVGLHFVHVPRSVYERGKTATNRVEAQAVADAALHHFRRFPHKSLGVGTFNIKQQQAIQEEIELQLKIHPEMESFFHADRREHFFVKNLETIQGDERDVILISVGYGRDAAGKLSLNFGPVNRDGGERRLNVLLSRARERCVIFANFSCADLPADGMSSKGLQALRAYLEFAETRRLPDASSAENQSDSAFENSVADELCAHGYEVRQRVGSAGFRIDVAIVDPQQPGRYLIAIECDGVKYHSSPVARDRDRLRQQILEKLGWTIHRVWSTDWYRNRAETTRRMFHAVEEANAAPRKILVAEIEEAPIVEEVETGVDSPIALPSREIPPYDVCRSLRIPTTGELHEVAPELLAVAVEDVVMVEGPVHADEVVRRIRTIWGLQRAGNRIRDAVAQATQIAIARRSVVRDGDFLRVPNAAVRLRRRNGDPPPKIDLISDAEVAEAIRDVLRTQFATPREDLVQSAARRLGILATSGVTATRVDDVIESGVVRGWWYARADAIALAE